MRITVVARTPAYLPNFRPILLALAERGHELHVAFEFEEERVPGQMAHLDELCERFPNVTRGTAPIRKDRLSRMADYLRRGLDSLRYREDRFADAPHLRARAYARAPARARIVVDSPLARRPRARALLRALLVGLERALPVPREVARLLERERPGVLAVTPLVTFGGSQTDFLRGARRRGIPTTAWIYSWDNLTSKGSIHEVPDQLMVWNDAQRREAVDLHGVHEDRVVITGAQAWDHWFEWRPSTSRAEFCERVGLRPDRPFVLYVGSSGGGLGLEAPFVARWIAAMRTSGVERLETVGVLVRPHPWGAPRQWEEAPAPEVGAVAVFPRAGEQPNSDRSRADFYDSIHHSSAVAGANTSAFIDAAIVGRPVLTVPAPEFRIAQTGTPHFSHFLSEGGGLLSLAGSLEEHLRELDSALAGDERWEQGRRRFLTAFVRPCGLDQPATPRFVAAVEALDGRPVHPPRATAGGMAARLALEGLDFAVHLGDRTKHLGDRTKRSLRKARRLVVRRLRRPARRAARRLRRAGRQTRAAAGRLVRVPRAGASGTFDQRDRPAGTSLARL